MILMLYVNSDYSESKDINNFLDSKVFYYFYFIFGEKGDRTLPEINEECKKNDSRTHRRLGYKGA